MRKTFVTNLLLLLFLNLLVKPFYIFGIDRTVQNVVGTEVYGLYAAMFSLSIIFNIILNIFIVFVLLFVFFPQQEHPYKSSAIQHFPTRMFLK